MAAPPESVARRSGRAIAWLAATAIAAFGLVAIVHEATRDTIAESARARELERFADVLAGVRYDNDLLADSLVLHDVGLLGTAAGVKAYRARLRGQPVAVVLEPVAPDGYAGPLQMLVAIAFDGRILGVRVTRHRETPGLGDFVDTRKSRWIGQFDGKSLVSPAAARWRVRRDGGDFDQYTGATVTSRAVTMAVADALAYYNAHREALLASPGYNRAMTPADILRAGLRDQNPGLVQLLGLCPLLAVSTSLGSGLGLGLATLVVLVASNALVSLVGRALPPEIRIAVFVLLIAALVTTVELVLAAWLPGLHAALGIFLPLIVTNCLLLARAEAFASRQPLGHAILDGFAMGCGFLAVLVGLGGARELLGRGSLGGDLHYLFQGAGPVSGIQLFAEQHGFLLALLPPGAFILLGLALALRQALRASPSPAETSPRAQAVDPLQGAS